MKLRISARDSVVERELTLPTRPIPSAERNAALHERLAAIRRARIVAENRKERDDG